MKIINTYQFILNVTQIKHEILNFDLHFMSITQYFEPQIMEFWIFCEKLVKVYRPSDTTQNFINAVNCGDFCSPIFLYGNMSISMLRGITITDIQLKG